MTPKYSIQKLLDNSQQALGVPKHVAAGAFVGVDKELTMPQAKKLIKQFKERTVE